MDSLVLWRDGRAWTGHWNATDNYAVVGIKSGADDPEAISQIPNFNLLRRDDVIRSDGEYDVIGLIRQHGGLRHKKGRYRPGDFNADACKGARRQESVRIESGSTGMDRATRAIEGVIDEVKRALMCESTLVGE